MCRWAARRSDRDFSPKYSAKTKKQNCRWRTKWRSGNCQIDDQTTTLKVNEVFVVACGNFFLLPTPHFPFYLVSAEVYFWCQLICLLFFSLILVWTLFFLSLGNDQESPQVEADREKNVGEKDDDDGAGYTGEGDGAQKEEGEASEEEEEEDEDGSVFETETEEETETTVTETDEDSGEKFNR